MAGKIIYIEDEEFFANITKKKLEEKGFEVEIAGDGEAGLVALKTGEYQLVLLDLTLPKVDGFEILEQLKGDAATKNIPVVVFSNQSEEGNKKRAMDLGAKAYYVKVNTMPGEIVKIVHNLLSDSE